MPKSVGFGHERLDVYKVTLEYIGWIYKSLIKGKKIDSHLKDQLFRAAQSILLNIAEGNGRGTFNDKRRFLEIARGSAMECAAIQDILVVAEVFSRSELNQGKELLVRIVSMLTKLGKRNYDSAKENQADYNSELD